MCGWGWFMMSTTHGLYLCGRAAYSTLAGIHQFAVDTYNTVEMNITDSTCWYGLAQTKDGCVRTLASYDPSSYHAYQIGYCVVGAASLLASATMTARAYKHDGSSLQRCNFIFCCYASLTLMIRGVDPSSYDHVIPRPISSFLSDSCTAALYSCYVLALGYWALVIQQGSGVINKPTRLKCLESAIIALVWAFYIVYDMLLFLYKGFNATGLAYLQLAVSAMVLGIICAVFLIYGLRVLSRLQDFETQKRHRMPSTLSERMMHRSFNIETLSDNEEGVPVVDESKYPARYPDSGHASKIKKILFVAVTLSIIVIAGQMYMAVQRTLTEPKELSCANGIGCADIKSSLNLLHVLQVVCIWAVLWTFRDIQRKDVQLQPL